MPIPIRPHHGMCLAYFEGKGYSEGFTKHMGEMLKIFEQDPAVHLTAATDRICSACPNNHKGICDSETKVERYDREVLSACALPEQSELSFLEFAQLVQAYVIAAGKREQICGDCQWNDLCKAKKSRWSE